MKSNETTQTKRTDEKLTAEQQATILQPPGTARPGTIEQEAVEGVNRAIGKYPKRFQHEVLSAILADVSKTTDRVNRLIELEPKVRAIVDRLDVRTKAVITVLEELAAVSSCTVGVDYGADLSFATIRDGKHVEAALRENPGDVDLACLAEVYELAQYVNTDGKPEALEEAETDGNLCPSEKMLRKWLLGLDLKSKLACSILGTLHFGDHGTDKLANEIYDEFQNEILATATNPPEKLSKDELIMTGVVAEQSIWHEHC